MDTLRNLLGKHVDHCWLHTKSFAICKMCTMYACWKRVPFLKNVTTQHLMIIAKWNEPTVGTSNGWLSTSVVLWCFGWWDVWTLQGCDLPEYCALCNAEMFLSIMCFVCNTPQIELGKEGMAKQRRDKLFIFHPCSNGWGRSTHQMLLEIRVHGTWYGSSVRGLLSNWLIYLNPPSKAVQNTKDALYFWLFSFFDIFEFMCRIYIYMCIYIYIF